MSDLQQSHLRLSLSPTESLKAEVEANDLLASERERSEGLVVEKMSLETRQITLTVNAEIVSTVAVKEKLEKEIDLMTTNAAKLKAELEDTNFKLMDGAIISLRMSEWMLTLNSKYCSCLLRGTLVQRSRGGAPQRCCVCSPHGDPWYQE
jgi:hypothetical protein